MTLKTFIETQTTPVKTITSLKYRFQDRFYTEGQITELYNTLNIN